jgi:AAA domain
MCELSGSVRAAPRCVIVTGRPGSGKTTLARKLREMLRMPMLSRDEVKEGFVSTFGVSHEDLPEDTNRKVTDLFFSVAQSFLAAKVSIVVEAAFQHRLWSDVVPRWSGVGRLSFIICDVDPTLCARRHLDRGLGDPSREYYHGDRRVKVFRETGEILGPWTYDPPAFDLPTLRVAAAEGYSPGLDAIRDFIMRDPAS